MGKNLLCFLQAWFQAPQHHRASEVPRSQCRTEHQSQGQAQQGLSTEKSNNFNKYQVLHLFVKGVPVPGVWTQLNFTPASSEKHSTYLWCSPWVKQIIQIAIHISETSTSVFKFGTFDGSNFYLRSEKFSKELAIQIDEVTWFWSQPLWSGCKVHSQPGIQQVALRPEARCPWSRGWWS